MSDDRSSSVVARLPGPLQLTPRSPFVGRRHELATLRNALPVAGGATRVALVSGEAGSGKTRLVRELAVDACARDVLVVYGACDTVVDAPYQAFADALAPLAEHAVEIDGDCTVRAEDLAPILPGLAPTAHSAAWQQADPAVSGARLHRAVAELLSCTSRHRPVLVVIDDLHAADPSTVHLLHHLARMGAIGPVLLVATLPDREGTARSPLSTVIADLSRVEGSVRVRLAGLTEADVDEYVRRSADMAPKADVSALTRRLIELTDGNAYLLGELWNGLIDAGTVRLDSGDVWLHSRLDDLESPESVQQVIQERLGELSAATVAVLEVAAVMGTEFALDVLLEVAGPGADVVRALDEAETQGTIVEIPNERTTHRFAHELVRTALYEGLTGVRRADLHLRTAEALDRVARGDEHVAQLAHHFVAAVPVGSSERAARYSARAARVAMASHAFDEAADAFEAALRLGIDDEAGRVELELALGTAHHLAGATGEAIEVFRSAAARARSLRDHEALATAAVGLEEASWRPGLGDDAVIALLEQAAAGLEGRRCSLRVRVLAAWSRAAILGGDQARAEAVYSEAVDMARQLGVRATLASTLLHASWFAHLWPARDVLTFQREAADLATAEGDTALAVQARLYSVPVLVDLGDLAGAAAVLDEAEASVEATHQPFLSYLADQQRSALALARGDLAEAERRARRSWDRSHLLRGGPPSAEHALQMFGVRRELGRLHELRPALDLLDAQARDELTWRPGLAVLHAELGMHDRAREQLHHLVADDLGGVPRDKLWIASLVYLADTCVLLGDADAATVVYRALEPFSGGILRVGQMSACYGAADRYLGVLAALDSRWDPAEAHLEYALFLNRRIGAHLWVARTACNLGSMLISRGRPGDTGRAADLIHDAAELATQHRLTAVSDAIRAIRTDASAEHAFPDGLSAREVDVLRLVATGCSNRDIGERLYISHHTVASHLRRILAKTGCANRTEAATFAHRHGLTATT